MPVKQLTPMMRQYKQLKQQYKDKILLFRMGDFYETFNEDAKTTSKVLNITLTSRDKNEDPTPLAGFPYHALDQYLPKLVKAGYNVAIADQVEDPKLAKGIVRREVTRVVTPGTLTDDRYSDDKKNNYLCSVFQQKKTYGLALCDLSTGEFLITETQNLNNLKDEISRISPSEILVSPKQDFSILSEYPIQPLDNYKYEYTKSKALLCKHFGKKSLASFGITNSQPSIISAGAIIDYLTETQKSDLSHISKLKYYDLKGNMILDSATLRNLDIMYSTSEMGSKASLIKILDRTETSMGARKLRRWVVHPLLNLKEIRQRQDMIDELFNDLSFLSNLKEHLKRVSDIERISGKIGLNRANARDLLSLSSTINEIIAISSNLKKSGYLKKLSRDILKNKAKLEELIKYIDKSIVDSPPNTIMEGHIIKEGFDKKIDKIKSETRASKEWINNLEKIEKERTGIPSLKVRSNKIFGYYIEITNTHKDKAPDDYIRKQTLVNSERYITPELKKKEAIVLNAQEKLNQLEYEVFQEIREHIIKYLDIIQEISDSISEIDVVACLAHIANQNNYCKPVLFDFGKEKGIIEIKNGRHPIVELVSNEEFISNDLNIDLGQNRLVILTGPNMSGKSTYIRQVALIILMAQIGSFVPASSAKISLTDRVFTRVGASDDLSAGRSTFLVEMDEAANIINNATKYSLIILDEVGRGTSTYDGVSIAWAIAEHIEQKIQSRCLFATHYHELVKLEDELEGIKNFNVAVVEEGDDVIFLRKIEKGGTNKSYGIHVAKMAGLPDDIIERAEEILSGFEQEDMFGVRSNVGSKKEQRPEITKNKDDKEGQLTFMDNNLSETMPSIFNELKALDLDKLTPLEALLVLEKWKKRLTR